MKNNNSHFDLNDIEMLLHSIHNPPRRIPLSVYVFTVHAEDSDLNSMTSTPVFCETGIKSLDLFAPLFVGSRVAFIAEDQGLGTKTLLKEIARSQGFFLKKDLSLRVWRHQLGGELDKASTSLGGIDSVVFLSKKLAESGSYPCIDPLQTQSLTAPEAYTDTADAVRTLLRDQALCSSKCITLGAQGLTPLELATIARARKLTNFLCQPLHSAMTVTDIPGVSAPWLDTMDTIQRLLDGRLDEVVYMAFSMTGPTVDERLIEQPQQPQQQKTEQQRPQEESKVDVHVPRSEGEGEPGCETLIETAGVVLYDAALSSRCRVSWEIDLILCGMGAFAFSQVGPVFALLFPPLVLAHNIAEARSYATSPIVSSVVLHPDTKRLQVTHRTTSVKAWWTDRMESYKITDPEVYLEAADNHMHMVYLMTGATDGERLLLHQKYWAESGFQRLQDELRQ